MKANKNITIVKREETTKNGILMAAMPHVGIVVDSDVGFSEGTKVVFKDGFEFRWENEEYVALDLFEIMAVVE
jgi:hypothetical protein|tara:strand:- start:1905 stop:2123 length:219 start_codon:yes stop_codon:yes gene_type:complete